MHSWKSQEGAALIRFLPLQSRLKRLVSLTQKALLLRKEFKERFVEGRGVLITHEMCGLGDDY